MSERGLQALLEDLPSSVGPGGCVGVSTFSFSAAESRNRLPIQAESRVYSKQLLHHEQAFIRCEGQKRQELANMAWAFAKSGQSD